MLKPETACAGTAQEEEPAGAKIVRRERIDCVCGVAGEEAYDGLWLQCDSCDAWLHGRCINMRRAPPGAPPNRYRV